jgi:hypothetical protein
MIPEMIPQSLTASEFLEGASAGCLFLACALQDGPNSSRHSIESEAVSGRGKRVVAIHKKEIPGRAAISMLQDPKTSVNFERRFVEKSVLQSKISRLLSGCVWHWRILLGYIIESLDTTHFTYTLPKVGRYPAS